jgi:hypothetical protein
VTFRELWFARETSWVSVCKVTLEGSLHAHTISKVRGTLIGYIMRAISSYEGFTCVAAFLNGEGGRPNTLPWHIRYNSFSGTLPTITSVHLEIRGLAFRYEPLGSRCLYVAEGTSPAFATLDRETSTSKIKEFSPDPEPGIPWHSTESGICPSEIQWGETGTSSSGTMVVAGSTELISLRLI